MATFSQQAKRLVLVAKTAYDSTNFDITGTAGNIGIFNANSALITDASSISADRIKIGLDAGHAAQLISETLKRGDVKAKGQAYQAPYEAATLLKYGAGTYDAGQELIVSIRFDGYGSLSMRNVYTKHGVYVVPADSTSSATVVSNLVQNLNKNLDKDGVPRATALIGSNATVDLATVISTAATINVTNGSTKAVLNANADASGSGWITVNGALLFATFTSGSADVLFDRPFVGATNATLAKANLVGLTSADLIIVGDPQSEVNFEHMMNKASFNVQALKNYEADGNVTITKLGSSIGVGYGPHVENIEKFANQTLNRDQFNGPDYERYNAPLNADRSVNYNVINVQIQTTKTGFGSNVTSVREIDIFLPENANYANLVTHLNAFK